MNTEVIVQQQTILYLVRESLFKTAATLCQSFFSKYNDPFFQFWKGVCYFKEGSVNEAINETILIQNRKEFQFAVSSAMIYYFQQQRTADRDTIDTFRQMQYEGRKTPNEKAIISGAHFYLLVEEYKKAKDCIELLSQAMPSAKTTLGWYQIYQTDEERNPAQIYSFFEELGSQFSTHKSLDYLLGLSKAAASAKKLQANLDAVNEIIVNYPQFAYGEIEKSKTLMMIGDWDQSLDCANKILYSDSNNIFALKACAFYKLAREGNIIEAVDKLDELSAAIDLQEPKNITLMLNISQLFSRVSGRSSKILSVTQTMLQKARKIQPLNADLCLEIAYQQLMLEEYDQAYSSYQEAAALDESRIEALSGMIQCKIQQGIIDDAEKQLEFLTEVQVSVGRTPEIAFLEAFLQCKKEPGSEVALKLLDESLKLHIALTKTLTPGYEFYIKLNPDFLVTLSQLYLLTLSTQNMLDGKEKVQGPIGKGTKLLETITKQIPGLTNAYLLLAIGKLGLGDQHEALKAINTVLEQDNTNEDAYILHALISMKTGSFATSQNSLNQAISNNFMIRENPMFMLVKGQVEYEMEDFKNSLATMESAYEIPGVKDKNQLKQGKSKILQFNDKNRCQIFVLYAKNLAKAKEDKKCKQVMQKAIQSFVGTSEEGNVMLANSEIAIESGDVKKAINILKAVQPKQPTYQKSRILLADVYLKHLKDRRNYTRCYGELIDANESFDNYLLMGAALLKINEPEEALKAYLKALKLQPENEQVIRFIGSCLSATYDYQKAIQYYESALQKNNKRNDLVIDLGKLYIRIGNLQKAEDLLQWEKFLTDDFTAPTQETLKQNSEGFLLIAKLLTKKQQMMQNQIQSIENSKQAQQLLAEANKLPLKIREAYENSIGSEKDLIEKIKIEGGNLEAERKVLGQLYIEVSKYYSVNEKNFKNAFECLEDANRIMPTSERIIQLQAECLYQMNDKAGCEQKLRMLQKINPNNDYASMTLSELLLQKDDSERAIMTFVQAIKQKPDSYGTLTKVIDWFRRQNRLEETKELIDLSTSKASNPNNSGLCFCRGLYYKYKLQPKEALSQFNIAKRNPSYAEDSLTHMIDIYLNPDQDLYYTLVEEQQRELNPENLKACDMLLKELSSIGNQQRFIVMQSYVLMLSQQKQAVDLSIQLLSQLLKQNPECLPAMHALAISKFIAKKQTEAKNLLKILWKKNIPSNGWEQEELERAWLLYADSFIAIQKYDQAEEVLKKCIKQNQSCGKAEEYMGVIKEKEQSYIDAADHYEKAFKLLNQKNPNMGYRLAFNYLKAKRYVDCINVSNLILAIDPNYPKIQKEIIEKAMHGLRP